MPKDLEILVLITGGLMAGIGTSLIAIIAYAFHRGILTI